MDVALVRWPGESERRDRLAADGFPRLLLVEDGAAPPIIEECAEDWIRVPASEVDLEARMAGVAVRAGHHRPSTPALDDDGVLRSGPHWVSLPPVEARLTEALLDRFGTVVSREALSKAGWPDGSPGRNALDVHVLRLRRRLSRLDLVIRTVRSRGYMLEADAGVNARRQA